MFIMLDMFSSVSSFHRFTTDSRLCVSFEFLCRLMSVIPRYIRVPRDVRMLLNQSSFDDIVQNLVFRFGLESKKNVKRYDDADADILVISIDRHTSDDELKSSYQTWQRLVEKEQRHVVVIEDDGDFLKGEWKSWSEDYRNTENEEVGSWMFLPPLTVLTGPMFAGKTSRLLEYVRYAEKQDKNNTWILKPEVDTRSVGFVRSHQGEMYPVTKSLKQNLREITCDNGTLVFIDEAQFFDDSIVEFCMNTIKTQPQSAIIAAGLDFDFQREPFGHMHRIIEQATKLLSFPSAISVERFLSTCRICGSPAPYTMRSSNIDTQILIGSSDAYYPACEEHHKKIS